MPLATDRDPSGVKQRNFSLTAEPTSMMTTRVNSQFPQPDLHRQDIPHYGLRTEITESLFGKVFVGWVQPTNSREKRWVSPTLQM